MNLTNRGEQNMEELITIDGTQYKLVTDRPLTTEQRIQTITEIRKSTGCGCGNKTVNLGIQKLQQLPPPPGTYEQPFTGCMGLNIGQTAPAITVQDFSINGVIPDFSTCGCYPGPCTPPGYCNGTIVCPGETCTATITWANTGNANGTFTPQVTIDGDTPITGDPATVTVPAQIDASPGTVIQTFSLHLSSGNHIICIDTLAIT